MVNASLERRVKNLETQVDELQGQLRAVQKVKDWRRTIGAFTNDEGMQQILRDAMRLQEADRKKVRAKTKPKRKPQR